MFLRVLLLSYLTFVVIDTMASEEQSYGTGGNFDAYAFRNFGGAGNGLVGFDLSDSGAITDIDLNGSTSSDIYFADFIGNDYSTLYVLKQQSDELVTVDTTTGAETLIGVASSMNSNDIWRGLTWDPLSNQLFAVNLTDLYVIDSTDASTNFIGRASNVLLGGLAADETGILYSVDTFNNNLVSIDPMTGTRSVIGGLGLNISSDQALDFDNGTGVLYWSGCAPSCNVFRRIDTATGSSSSHSTGQLGPSGTQYAGLAIAMTDDLIFRNGFE